MTATADQILDPTARIDHSIIMVDPAMAARWLTRNAKNRTIRERTVQRYRSDMIAGRWTFAADPVRFAADGTLLDGQHRLTALADLDGLDDQTVTVPMLVVRGLPNESQAVMDQGAKRTPGDQLALRGYRETNALAAAVKQTILWEDGFLFRDQKLHTTITSSRIEEWVETHTLDIDFFYKVVGLTKRTDAPPSIAAVAAIAFGRIHEGEALEFFTLLARGAGTHGHPIVTLDKRLQRVRREGLKMPHRDYLALFFMSWNAWRDGRELQKFQRPRGGTWTEENFPCPR